MYLRHLVHNIYMKHPVHDMYLRHPVHDIYVKHTVHVTSYQVQLQNKVRDLRNYLDICLFRTYLILNKKIHNDSLSHVLPSNKLQVWEYTGLTR